MQEIYLQLDFKLSKQPEIAYARHSLHESTNEKIHYMFMLLRPLTSIIQHKSLTDGYNYYDVISGEIKISTSNNRTFIDNSIKVISENIPARIDRYLWRRISNSLTQPCFYAEICNGPFRSSDTMWK